MASSSPVDASSSKRGRISTVIRGLLLIFYVVTIVDGFVVIPSVATGTTFLSPSLSSSSPSSYFTSLSTSLNSSSNDSNDDQNVDRGLNLLGVASKVVPQGNIVKTAKFFWKFIWLRFMTELAPQDKSTGDYKRPTYGFDNFISDGSSEFPIESDRYHLYVGNPCPWCHRVRLIVNILKLQSTLDGVTILIDNPEKASRGGWIFDDNDVASSSQLQKQKFQDLRELYDQLSPGYTGRCTAPLLVDWKTNRIVSNESKDIVRMLPLLLQTKDKSSSSSSSSSTVSLDPTLISTELQSVIDMRCEWIYELVNNGVYRCGFATTQYAYDVASEDVLTGLKRIEDILSNQNYLCSNTQFTESDLMLLPTMLRYDGVYGPLFNAGGTHIRIECDYPYTFQWLKRCWNNIPGVKDSIDITDACESYYRQLFPLNPGGIVPSPSITSALLHLD
mmetsp:Transcript_25404/g.28400  ORF Transcript_25404/g.28400 Transcript_25404/m.28400 type:complete len:446 (+) Transcript_25404:52-1389(+)